MLFPSRCQHHRHSQKLLQQFSVYPKAPLLRFVHEIDADDHISRLLEDLQYKDQRSLQTASVTDRNDPVRSAGGYIFRGNLFIFTFPVEGIGSR